MTVNAPYMPTKEIICQVDHVNIRLQSIALVLIYFTWNISAIERYG